MNLNKIITQFLLSEGNMDPWHALGIINATDPFYNDGVLQCYFAPSPPLSP